ncbi:MULTISPECIES: hypothetical protein [unclassified Streptomyces]|uniref:hypothetical protein n=1 Tax=unclassified Streptomyces TaxID=2593676 RepID=UPI00225405C8|nr:MULTISPECIES: hypothetical protein [unclassified Streptomyces]MCX5047239.1 hypothetical protein [Streptomyces sp. NBC_00474]MCX5058062.1 hypothetical protein [Streptomyces sp. NBC_00452]MCX5245058.1 hypothetical protein [Streptomyces sp. NBC_00201]MCX5289210.1 hypothetical protein [Streptomyces sp. NBC_00183]
MKIDWAALGSVFGVSLAVTVGLVALFTLGVMGLSRRERAATQGDSAAAAVTAAYVCFAACAAAVAYGIYLVVVKA